MSDGSGVCGSCDSGESVGVSVSAHGRVIGQGWERSLGRSTG